MKTEFHLSMLISFTVLLASMLLASVIVSAAQPGDGSQPAQERIEMEMEKRSTNENTEMSREQMRTTEEMQKEKGMDSDNTMPERETSRKWWEFWK